MYGILTIANRRRAKKGRKEERRRKRGEEGAGMVALTGGKRAWFMVPV